MRRGLSFDMWPLILLNLLAPGVVEGENRAVELAVVEEARDGRMDRDRLLEAALTLSGQVDITKRAEYLVTIESITNAAKQDANASAPPRDLARRMIDAMHAKALRGFFDADCASVEEAFTTGRHNCVTSLILALELCRHEGISATAMQHEHHVWLRVGDTAEGDLETTKLAPRARSQKDVRPLSDAQLLSRLLYNQARNRHEQGDYRDAALRLEWCLAIDSEFEAAERNLRIVLGNWMTTAAEGRRFSEAMAVGAKALTQFPGDEGFERNAAFLQREWAAWRAENAASESSVEAGSSAVTR
jgi:hypothetical protein